MRTFIYCDQRLAWSKRVVALCTASQFISKINIVSLIDKLMWDTTPLIWKSDGPLTYKSLSDVSLMRKSNGPLHCNSKTASFHLSKMLSTRYNASQTLISLALCTASLTYIYVPLIYTSIDSLHGKTRILFPWYKRSTGPWHRKARKGSASIALQAKDYWCGFN